MKTLCSEVKGFSIDQEWSAVRKLYSFVLNQKNLPERTNEFNLIKHKNYSVHQIGDLSTTWNILGGEQLMKLFPWYSSFVDYVSGLRYDGVGYSVTKSNIKRHFDPPDVASLTGIEPSERQCKLNYIITCDDPGCKTKVWDRSDSNNIQEYRSVPGKGFILDINHDHAVECNGTREFLTFRFCNTLEEVKNYFESNGPFIWPVEKD